jgi:hypothetical protein
MNINRVCVLFGLSIVVCGCATRAPGEYLDYMEIRPANYSEDYIHDFHVQTEAGRDLVVTGYDVKPFSKGGLSSPACCAPLPGIGQTIRIKWRTGGNYNTPESEWVDHSGWTAIKGAISADRDTNTYLILRFFPNNKIEAEYISQL